MSGLAGPDIDKSASIDALRRGGYTSPHSSSSLHALEQVRVAAADFELLVVALDRHDLAAAEVARDRSDTRYRHQRRAVDLPEELGVEFIDQFLDRLADQRFDLVVCTRVYFSSLMKNSTSSTGIIWMPGRRSPGSTSGAGRVPPEAVRRQ